MNYCLSSRQWWQSNFTVPPLYSKSKSIFHGSHYALCSPNRRWTVCVASWVINPEYHLAKFGCSRFCSAPSWDLSAGKTLRCILIYSWCLAHGFSTSRVTEISLVLQEISVRRQKHIMLHTVDVPYEMRVNIVCILNKPIGFYFINEFWL